MKIIKLILVIMLFLFALALGSKNQEVVSFSYLFAKSELHLSTLLGIVFVSGFALAWIIVGSMHFKSQLTIYRLNRKLKKSGTNQQPEKTEA